MLPALGLLLLAGGLVGWWPEPAAEKTVGFLALPRGGAGPAQALVPDALIPAGVPVLALPVRDATALVREAEALDRQRGGGLMRFAEAVEVHLSPDTAGSWERLADGRERWRLGLRSPGATSLNLGFRRFRMPEGGRLSIRPPGAGAARDFTARDEAAHGELWTPIYAGGELLLELTVPRGGRDGLELVLSQVNHGFRGMGTPKIGGSISADCHVDVACTEDPAVGALVQAYADPIRAAAAFTVGGVDRGSGALINNTRRDRRPFFLTAAHAGITPGNAASVVVYFNFQNSSCRTPGSAASGAAGDGELSQFVSGTIWRAAWQPSDFCLLELDEPVPAAFEAHYAGWDRSATHGPGVCVHHPGVAEKRISFELDATIDFPGKPDQLVVADWDHGSTAGGSSGAPLFDGAGRIFGQLTGGFAECGNDEFDSFGRFSASWTGGGSPTTRLSDWLDPAGTGALALDGVDRAPLLAEWLEMQAAAAGRTFSGGTPAELAARDEDGDGLANGLEFALGRQAYLTDSLPPVLELDLSCAPAVLRFERAIAGIDYVVETSSDPGGGSWTSRASNPGIVGQSVEIAIDPGWAVGGRLFARLRVEGFE